MAFLSHAELLEGRNNRNVSAESQSVQSVWTGVGLGTVEPQQPVTNQTAPVGFGVKKITFFWYLASSDFLSGGEQTCKTERCGNSDGYNLGKHISL